MYAFDSRVRFSEADHHETITLLSNAYIAQGEDE